ncbi:MAG: hypothetical protein QXR62_04590 [Candidatus Bathyarchaeia archaeon]
MSHAYIASLLSRIEALEREVAALKSQLAAIQLPIQVPTVIIAQPALNNRRKVFTIDLSIARANEPLGILRETEGHNLNTLTCLKCDGTLYIRVNTDVGDLEPVSTGYKIENFDIYEVYLTNVAQSGEAIFVGEWRE